LDGAVGAYCWKLPRLTTIVEKLYARVEGDRGGIRGGFLG
jgi:hypothetical protein